VSRSPSGAQVCVWFRLAKVRAHRGHAHMWPSLSGPHARLPQVLRCRASTNHGEMNASAMVEECIAALIDRAGSGKVITVRPANVLR
jgi:hypothetical protein